MRYAAAVGEGGARPRGEGGGGGGGGPARVAVRASRRWSSKLPGCWQESRCARRGERASLVAGARSPACHGRRGVHVGRHRLRRSSARQRKRNRRCRAGWGIGVEIASPGYICEVLSTAPALHLAYFRGVRALIEDPPRISVRLGRVTPTLPSPACGGGDIAAALAAISSVMNPFSMSLATAAGSRSAGSPQPPPPPDSRISMSSGWITRQVCLVWISRGGRPSE